jgi:hypothetical protein
VRARYGSTYREVKMYHDRFYRILWWVGLPLRVVGLGLILGIGILLIPQDKDEVVSILRGAFTPPK